MAKSTKRSRSRAAAATTAAGTRAQTIIYVHGIGNKPQESVLRCQWDRALIGFGLGERSRMAYWCQTDRHGPPKAATCADADAVETTPVGLAGFGARSIARAVAEPDALEDVIKDINPVPAQQKSLERLLEEMPRPATAAVAGTREARRLGAERFGDFDIFDPIARLVTALFLKDVNDFFFDTNRRTRMKERLRARLSAGGGPFVVIAHSLGSAIAYSLLQELGDDVDVALFVTIGSPLGLGEMRDQLRKINGLRKGLLPSPDGVRRWVNIFDRLDVVAQRERLGKHYSGPAVPEDLELANMEGPKEAHSATGYLSLPRLRGEVRDHVDLERFQRLARFTLAADVTTDFERAPRETRRPLLIELTDPVWAQNTLRAKDKDPKGLPDNRAEMAERVVQLVEGITKRKHNDPELGIQRLERYMSVRLTEWEAHKLASDDEWKRLGLPLPPFYRVWRNARKVALLDTSIHQVQASAAHQAYDAKGRGIQWAVLDSGCAKGHPHFRRHDNIAAAWDCTKLTDTPIKNGVKARDGVADSTDRFGHGTHVAGIIAGAFEFPARHRLPGLSGIAPEAKLHIYKVLDDEGQGDDAWIIKALDHIASINERAGTLEIAGVNLSLGGEFEQGVFGCGHTPLCDELRRLWRQGVLVVLAAGNEGFRRLMSSDGEFGANIPCSIGDPANLEEAIAVGAVHKEKPHTFGVSHFSSRGPTADGRKKPDCVAPGEQILSCRHNFRRVAAGAVTTRDLYYKLDGTSMAAPHVSGLLACFLSRKREFIGQPDRVKRILLENCTDLGRDRSLQGAGLPNLVKMLVQT